MRDHLAFTNLEFRNFTVAAECHDKSGVFWRWPLWCIFAENPHLASQNPAHATSSSHQFLFGFILLDDRPSPAAGEFWAAPSGAETAADTANALLGLIAAQASGEGAVPPIDAEDSASTSSSSE